MKLLSRFKRVARYISLSRSLNKAVREADKKSAADNGKTYFVVKGKGVLLVLTRKQYKRLVRKGKACPVTLEQMYQGCYYCTDWFHQPITRDIIQKKRRIFFAIFLDSDIKI